MRVLFSINSNRKYIHVIFFRNFRLQRVICTIQGWPRLHWLLSDQLPKPPKDFALPSLPTDAETAYIECTTDRDGTVKGVCVSRSAMFAHCRAITAAMGYREGDTMVCVLDFKKDVGFWHAVLTVRIRLIDLVVTPSSNHVVLLCSGPRTVRMRAKRKPARISGIFLESRIGVASAPDGWRPPCGLTFIYAYLTVPTLLQRANLFVPNLFLSYLPLPRPTSS